MQRPLYLTFTLQRERRTVIMLFLKMAFSKILHDVLTNFFEHETFDWHESKFVTEEQEPGNLHIEDSPLVEQCGISFLPVDSTYTTTKNHCVTRRIFIQAPIILTRTNTCPVVAKAVIVHVVLLNHEPQNWNETVDGHLLDGDTDDVADVDKNANSSLWLSRDVKGLGGR